jgi:hypothetical protein
MSGCTAVDKVDLPNADYVYMSGCTAVDKVDLPNADYVDMRGCTAVDKVDLPNAVVNTDFAISELNAITLDAYQAAGGPMEGLLVAGGVSIEEVLQSGAWDCHDWSNCPLHVAHGVETVEELPRNLQPEGSRFLRLFDGGFLRRPDHLISNSSATV